MWINCHKERSSITNINYKTIYQYCVIIFIQVFNQTTQSYIYTAIEIIRYCNCIKKQNSHKMIAINTVIMMNSTKYIFEIDEYIHRNCSNMNEIK